jgi:hypothetical protein
LRSPTDFAPSDTKFDVSCKWPLKIAVAHGRVANGIDGATVWCPFPHCRRSEWRHFLPPLHIMLTPNWQLAAGVRSLWLTRLG